MYQFDVQIYNQKKSLSTLNPFSTLTRFVFALSSQKIVNISLENSEYHKYAYEKATNEVKSQLFMAPK